MSAASHKEVAIIRTSDRQTFKRCRRKWALSSHLRHNRAFNDQLQYFWFGSGGHYALEDYHGYNYYQHPVEAFKAYITAWKSYAHENPKVKLPLDIADLEQLGIGILSYYADHWLHTRDKYQTLWVNGVPQCEVKCELILPYKNEHFDEVRYQVTLDRMVVIDNELWIVDYKFYGRDWSTNLDFDTQMAAYIWAAQAIYDKPVRGAIMQKHFKKVPDMPKILSNGRVSTDKNQGTTYGLYKKVLEEMYITVEQAPLANRKCLEELMMAEGMDRDDFIQRDKTERNLQQQESEGEQILMEVADMCNPELPLYKNSTKDCAWDCPFSDICVMMDMQLDWESVLEEATVNRHEETDSWRQHLPHLQLGLQPNPL